MALSKTLIFNVLRSEHEVVHANHTSNHEVKHLSDIDDQQRLRFFVPVIFFYPPSSSALFFYPPSFSALDPTKTIRDGLARALEAYYPLAGRLYEGPNKKLFVKCNNEGVMFVQARANVKLEQLGDGILPSCPYLEKLIVCESYTKVLDSPLLLFQVTTFICGGFSVGVLFNHTLLDGAGIVQFLHAIGDMVKGASEPSIRPVWRRELLTARLPPRITGIHSELARTFTTNGPPRYSDDTFVLTSVTFSPKEIHALRSQLPIIPPPGASYSTFDMITACLWKCHTIALEPHPDDMVHVTIIMNIPNWKWGKVPKGYYGNAFAFPAAVSKAGVLCASLLGHAVDLVRQAKTKMSEEYFKSMLDLVVNKEWPKYSDTWKFIVSDLTGLGCDKIDLGWGNPSYTGVSRGTRVISFYNKIKISNGEVGVAVPI